MRKKIVAANWKMNLSYADSMALADLLADDAGDTDCTVLIAAPFVYLHELVGRIQSHPNFSIAAQNCSDKASGAFTGEISAAMLSSIGVDYVIIGHSERRKYFHEDDKMIAAKISRALENGLAPIFCCGEDISQRKAGNHFNIVEGQLKTALSGLDEKQLSECIIAYEPVWAIGTGVNATPDQASEMHAFIRNFIGEYFSRTLAEKLSIIYGGSVTSSNANDLFNSPGIDGGLVGGASLSSPEFLKIIESMNSVMKVKS